MSEKDALAQTLAECLYTKIGKGQGNTTSGALAEALLASDWLAEHDREVAAKAWAEGFDEPRECCGLCPNNSCPWDNGKDGPSNPYEQKGVKG